MQKLKNTAANRQEKMDKEIVNERESTIQSDKTTSSSSATLTESTNSYISIQESIEEEGSFDNSIYDTDNESVNAEDEPEYIQCKPLEEVVDFFEVLGDIPNLEDISEDISEVIFMSFEKPVVVEETIKDIGKFVDPLSGIEIQSNEETKSVDDEVVAAAVPDAIEEAAEEEDNESLDSDDFLLLDDIFEEDEEIKKVTEAEDTFETFLELETKKDVVVVDEIDWEAIAREQEAKRVYQHTLDFLNKLIGRVVERVEYVSPEETLRQNLDKIKLLKELSSKLTSYSKEKSVHQFLHHKMIQYFRRKRSFRPITPDNPKTVTQDTLKFKNAIKRLDNLLEKESKLTGTTSKKIENLQSEYKRAKKEAETQIQLFASMVKTTLFRENYSKLNALIELLLTRMNKFRTAVSEVRLEMLIKQHTQAHLMESLAKLEDLGNGLSMRDFGSLQAETRTLDKKIEERNTELNKTHMRCHSNIHTMAHLKEKQKMLRSVITIQRSVLKAALEEKQAIREYLHNLKLRHQHIRKQIKELSFRGGLLDKPALMSDYDATVERVNRQQAIVDDLKKHLLATQLKIDEIVKKMK